VFPAGDVPALAEATREAFSDPVRLKQWGAASREIVQNYTYEEATKGLRKALEFLKCGKGETLKLTKSRK
jgi:glycosyltransferase involved in cell wall biosynthesis